MQEKPVSVGCGVIDGVDAIPVRIEATMRGESASPRILGRVDSVVREAYHRILSAFPACGVPPPRGVPLLNFLPASIPKCGSGFDLPMALALAGAGGCFPRERSRQLAALGEVSLEGRILPVRGAVAVALAARARGWDSLVTSVENAPAAALVPGISVYGVRRLIEALRWLRGELDLPRASADPALARRRAGEIADLADIRGHETPKTSLVVAAAGRHNLLFVGPPGSGKSALLHRLPGLLPPTSDEEALEILKIHTVHGVDPGFAFRARPVRAPHHTSSHVSLLGGGSDPRPGEVTLAQHGVLFLDELPEFKREALEGLRQPLETRSITIGRAQRTTRMPADFLLVAAMNPCPCGYLGHRTRPCRCTPPLRRRYAARISGPLLDRIDLQVEVPALDPVCFRGPPQQEWGTQSLRDRVKEAIERQQRRNAPANGCRFVPNGRLEDRALARAVGASAAVLDTMEEVLRANQLSGRARVRLLRIARTIADLEGRERVLPEDVLAAARLRGLERLFT